jgi:hypothetical protein
MGLSRRELLQVPAAMQLGGRHEPWYSRPMRWGQLTLVEDDPPKLDVGYWLDYFRRCHCDAVTLSAGGVVAYYPTKIPMHYRSAYLGTRDSFGELCRGCQKMGMVVVARVDPHAAHEDMFRAHPDWMAVDEQGKIRHHWVMPELYVTCPHGPYNRVFLTEVMREVVANYGVDGIFANRWANTASFEVCYCRNCRQSFGQDLPRTRDPRDKVWRDYTLWYQESLFSLMKLWDGEIRKIRPEATFLPNSGGGVTNALDWKRFGEMAETLISDHQGRSGVIPPWSNGMSAKVFRSSAGKKAIVGIFGINLATSHRWMKSVKSDAEQQVWIADGVANDFRPWFTKFGGVQEDERWMPVVEKFYKWHKTAEKYLRDREPVARVGMVYSQQTSHYYNGPVHDSVNGMYHALIEARVPFEMVHDHLLDAASLARYKLLVLPNVAALSDRQCEQLRAFAKAGGSLVATFETALFDEWGNPRKEFGLGDVFGIRYRGRVLGPLRNSYLAFAGKPGQRHPILAGFDTAAYTVNSIRRVDTEGDGDSPITLIPSYPDLPMEYVYERVPRGHVAQVFLRESGASRTVYFPMDLDRTFWEFLLEDHGRLLANAVRWAMAEPPSLVVEGPGILDISLWRQKSALVAHLVNLTNPMMMKGPIRELVPVGAQAVRIRLPRDARVSQVHLLVSGAKPAISVRDGWLDLQVPSVLDHEVIAVDL